MATAATLHCRRFWRQPCPGRWSCSRAGSPGLRSARVRQERPDPLRAPSSRVRTARSAAPARPPHPQARIAAVLPAESGGAVVSSGPVLEDGDSDAEIGGQGLGAVEPRGHQGGAGCRDRCCAGCCGGGATSGAEQPAPPPVMVQRRQAGDPGSARAAPPRWCHGGGPAPATCRRGR